MKKSLPIAALLSILLAACVTPPKDNTWVGNGQATEQQSTVRKSSQAPVPAVATAPKPAPAQSEVASTPPAATDNRDEVLKAIHGWATAWSAQNVKQYLSFYAPDFKTPHGMSRSSWKAFRNGRLTRPKYIHVKVISPEVKFTDATHAVVTFKEDYRASHYKCVCHKSLQLEQADGQWLIREEQ